MDTTKPTPRSEQQANRRYLTVWRWHFYFGLLVAPFLTLLAITAYTRYPAGASAAFVGAGGSGAAVCEP